MTGPQLQHDATTSGGSAPPPPSSPSASVSSRPVLYMDYFSQPSRACAIFVRANHLPVDLREVLIHKGQTRAAEYKTLNPLGKVPFLEDISVSLGLPESGAILSYLANRYHTPQHWLPSASLYASRRAAVESGMHWYHSNIRAGCARLVFNTVLAPRLGVVPNPSIAAEGKEILSLALGQLEKYWLQGGGRPFMAGSEVSLADLLCCCELEQLTMMSKEKHGTDLEDQLVGRPLIRKWMAMVAEACGGDTYETVHLPLRRNVAAAASSSMKKASSGPFPSSKL